MGLLRKKREPKVKNGKRNAHSPWGGGGKGEKPQERSSKAVRSSKAAVPNGGGSVNHIPILERCWFWPQVGKSKEIRGHLISEKKNNVGLER